MDSGFRRNDGEKGPEPINRAGAGGLSPSGLGLSLALHLLAGLLILNFPLLWAEGGDGAPGPPGVMMINFGGGAEGENGGGEASRSPAEAAPEPEAAEPETPDADLTPPPSPDPPAEMDLRPTEVKKLPEPAEKRTPPTPKPKAEAPKAKAAAKAERPSETAGDGSGAAGSGAAGPGSGAGGGGGGGGGDAAGYMKGNYEYIKKRIRQHLVYSPQAKRLGIQGVVTVSFTIQRDGQAQNIAVSRSSGHDSLDGPALDAVRNASPFPPPPAPARIVVPISFSLK